MRMLCGCRTLTNGMESSFEELDVDYTTNEDGIDGKIGEQERLWQMYTLLIVLYVLYVLP